MAKASVTVKLSDSESITYESTSEKGTITLTDEGFSIIQALNRLAAAIEGFRLR